MNKTEWYSALSGELFYIFKHSDIYTTCLNIKTVSLATLCVYCFNVIVHTSLQDKNAVLFITYVIYRDCSEGYINQMAVISENNLPWSSSRDVLIFRLVLQHLFRQYNLLIYIAAKLNLLRCLKFYFRFTV